MAGRQLFSIDRFAFFRKQPQDAPQAPRCFHANHTHGHISFLLFSDQQQPQQNQRRADQRKPCPTRHAKQNHQYPRADQRIPGNAEKNAPAAGIALNPHLIFPLPWQNEPPPLQSILRKYERYDFQHEREMKTTMPKAAKKKNEMIVKSHFRLYNHERTQFFLRGKVAST